MNNHIKLLLLLFSISILIVSCSTENDYTDTDLHIEKLVVAQSPEATKKNDTPESPIVVSSLFFEQLLFINHRGLNEYPENTFVAINAAILSGYKAVECDICMTRDSIFVLQHDSTIDRCSNGIGKVNDMTYEELLAYDFGSWKNNSFAGERIARLDDMLDLFKEKGLIIELDIADETRFKREWIPVLYELVKQKGMLGQTVFTATLNVFEDFLTEPRDIIISVSGITHRSYAEQALTLKDRVTLFSFSVSQFYLSKGMCDYAHENGVKIKTWTTTTREENEYCLSLGADYIITEVPYEQTVTTGMHQIHV